MVKFVGTGFSKMLKDSRFKIQEPRQKIQDIRINTFEARHTI